MSCYLRAVYVADPRDVFIRDAKVVNAGARRDGAVLQRCCDVNATILRHTPGVRTNPHEPETISLARSKDGWERWRSAPISIDQMDGNTDEGCVFGLHADIVGRRGFWNGERGRRRGGDPRRRSPMIPFEAFLNQLRQFIASPKEHDRPTEHPPVTGRLVDVDRAHLNRRMMVKIGWTLSFPMFLATFAQDGDHAKRFERLLSTCSIADLILAVLSKEYGPSVCSIDGIGRQAPAMTPLFQAAAALRSTANSRTSLDGGRALPVSK